MFRRLHKFINIVLIFTLLWGRVFFVLPLAIAEELTIPSAPPPPMMNSSPPSPPSAPQAPTAPSAPPPPAESTQTVVSLPTAPPAPTEPPLPGSEALPTIVSPSASPTVLATEDAVTNPTSAQIASPAQSASNNSDNETTKSASLNDPANVSTGPLSKNYAAESLEAKQTKLNQDLAELQNKIDALSTTGFNYANLNTLDGKVVTGDTQAVVNLLNKLNSNLTGIGNFEVYNIYGVQTGNIIFNFLAPDSNAFTAVPATISKNELSGPGSSNVADASNSFTVKEANGSDAAITNEVTLSAVTGGNSASGNTGSGTIKTGKAIALANLINLTNTNLNVAQWLIGVVNIFGELAGNIILPQEAESPANTSNTNSTAGSLLVENSTTGPASSNLSSLATSSQTNFATANSADITSHVEATANSGNNVASFNTGGGVVATGDSDTSVKNTTIVNSNIIAEEGTVWLIIVNEMGKWVGQIVGAPWGTTVASNSLPLISEKGTAGSQTFSTLVANEGTGPLSDNQSSLETQTEESLSTQNQAGITNNIQATADSGNNTASDNTGSGQIESGAAKTGVNLINMANTSVVAKKFVAIFVNVLGSLFGAIVPPNDQGKQLLGGATTVVQGESNPTSSQSLGGDVSSQGSTTYTLKPTPVLAHSGEINQGTAPQYLYTYAYYYFDTISPSVSPSYNQAVITVAKQKQQVQTQTANYRNLSSLQTNLRRGIYLSPNFIKTTESSLPGMLLAGAKINVTQSWLVVVPLAVIIFFFRRRKRYELVKYLHAFLEVIL